MGMPSFTDKDFTTYSTESLFHGDENMEDEMVYADHDDEEVTD